MSFKNGNVSNVGENVTSAAEAMNNLYEYLKAGFDEIISIDKSLSDVKKEC